MKIIENKQEYETLLNDNEAVFVDFYADWCGPCKMLGPVVEQLAEIETGVAFAKVNVDHNPDIASMYGIMSIPTVIVFKNGQPVANSVGFQPLPQLQKMLEKAK